MKKIIVAAAAAAVIAAGCSKSPDNQVVAKVNRARITVADFKKQMRDLPIQMQQAVATDPKARKDFLDDLIGIEAVIQEARRQGIDRDPEFKRNIQDVIRNELFNGLLRKELKGRLKPPTDEEIKEYYDAHKNEMRTQKGKLLSFKEAMPQLRSFLTQQKRREVYLEYSKGLKSRSKISVDGKVMASLNEKTLKSSPMQEVLELPKPPAQGEGK